MILYSDLEKVAAGIGEKFSVLFQALGVCITALVVGFIYLWQASLLMLGCAPIVILVGSITQWVSVYFYYQVAQYPIIVYAYTCIAHEACRLTKLYDTFPRIFI